MAVLRDHPYGQFNFLVDLGTGDTDGPDGGFQECSPIGMEVAVAEYRNGNDKENSAAQDRRASRRSPTSRCKRGIIGSLVAVRVDPPGARRRPVDAHGDDPAR